jgi:hypothetical protein
MVRASLKRLPAWEWLVILWTASTAARFLLALLMTQNPIIMPDESLYINLSRSILNGWVALRGQPVTYDSLLYPLLLSPLRALHGRVDFYRAAQLMNAALISFSVVPAWALARDITGDGRKALGVALLTALMSDFSISQILMAENLCYPLAVTALYLSYQALGEKGTAADAALAALVAGLCYMAKPGYAALGGTLCALLFYRAARRQKGALAQALAAVTAFFGMIALNRLIGLRLGIDYSWNSVYQNQTPPLTWEGAAKALQTSLLYLYFLPLALLAFPAILPVANAGRLDRGERGLTAAICVAGAVMILGTCYAVTLSEYSGAPFAARVHIRYFSFFAPALIALMLSTRLEGVRLNRRTVAALAFLAAASVAFTPKALLSGRNYTVDALGLASVTGDWSLTDPKALFQLLSLVLLLAGGWQLHASGWTKRFRRGLMIALAAFMLVNNIAGYGLMRHNEDATWAADACEAAGWMDGSGALFVAGDGQFFWNPATALEARSKDQLQAVELDDLIKNTGAGGVFQPFVPRGYWATRAVRAIAEPKYLVLDSDLLSTLVLKQGATRFVTGNGHYTFVQLPEDGAWVHSALSGLDEGWVADGSRLTVFDPSLCGGKQMTVWFSAHASASGGTLTLTVNNETSTLQMGTSEGWFQCTFDIPGDGQPVTVGLFAEGSVSVGTYLVG